MAALAARNPDAETEYAGNSRRVVKYDPDRTEKLMDWCDHIITQPVMNLENADHHEVLRSRFAGKITFMPYIWVDGLYSLCAAPGTRAKVAMNGKAGIVGEDIIASHLRAHGFASTWADFRSGNIDFDHKGRLERSLDELARREEFADVQVSPMIRDLYRDMPVMLTHNHPHPMIVNEIAAKLAARLELKWSPITRDDPLRFAAITLPEAGKVLSPYGASELGLKYDYDLQWMKAGRDLIGEIADAIGEGADRPAAAEKPAEKLAAEPAPRGPAGDRETERERAREQVRAERRLARQAEARIARKVKAGG